MGTWPGAGWMMTSLFPVSRMKKASREAGASREWLGEKEHSCGFQIPRYGEEDEGRVCW